jgi:hypothetical protein
MSFTNLKYDTSTNKVDLRESTDLLKYHFNTPQQCEECFLNDPNLIMQRAGNSVDVQNPMIDIDSELMGITRKATNDPYKKFIPTLDKEGNPTDNSVKINFDDCKMPKVESTRLSNPAENLRGTGWNRWEWLCHDPQSKLEMPFSWNTNTKLLAKDQHRPYVPNVIDNSSVLPKPNNKPLIEDDIQSVDVVPTEPVSVQWRSLKDINKN